MLPSRLEEMPHRISKSWKKHWKIRPTMFWEVAVLAVMLALVEGQFHGPVRSPGRILEPPVPVLCSQRTIHENFNGKGYFFSWKDPRTANLEQDWLGARNYCRMRCMDLVSLETNTENEYIKQKLVTVMFRCGSISYATDNVKYIWTSGRLCDFKGCERPDLQPISVNGWFWSAELRKLPPSTDRAQNDWSETGGIGRPQPDNREVIQQHGAPESCLAVLNNYYNDGVHWHDVACHHRKSFVCEENEALLKYIRFTNPNLRI